MRRQVGAEPGSNPNMDLEAFGTFFAEKGYKVTYLSKNNWAKDAD